MSEEPPYIKELAEDLRFKSDERKNKDGNTKFTQKFKDINNNWISSAFQQSERIIKVNPPKEIHRPDPVPKYTDFSPEQSEIGEKVDGTISVEKVQQFLKLQNNISELKPQTVADSTRPIVVYKYQISKPERLYKPQEKYLQIDLKQFNPTTPKIKNSKVTGYFQLYDVSIPDFVSQPVFFKVEGSEMYSAQSSLRTICLEIPEERPTIRLLYVVNITDNELDQPVALSLIKLYDKQGNPLLQNKYLPSNLYTINNPYITQALDLAIHEKEAGAEVIDSTSTFNYLTIPASKAKPFQYAWETDANKPLCVPSFPIKNYSPYPVITIREMWATLNLKKGKVYYKACILEKPDYDKPKPIPNIVNKSAPGLTEYFFSPIFAGNKKHTYPDFISIVPSSNILNQFLYIQFVSIDETEKVPQKSIYFAVIPLKNIAGNKNTTIETELYSSIKDIPKDAHKNLYPIKKTEGLSLVITIPTFYFPPEAVANTFVDNFDLPKLEGLDKESVNYYIIPLACRLFQKRDPKSFPTLVKLLQLFGEGGMVSLRKWIFNHYDPSTLGEDFGKFFAQGLIDFNKSFLKSETPLTEIESYGTTLPIILDIIAVTQADGRVKIEISQFLEIIDSFTTLITFMATKDVDAKIITEIFANFFFNHVALIGQERLASIVYQFIRTLSIIRPTLNVPMVATRLQWIFLSPLAYSNHFLVVLATRVKPLSTNAMYSPYSKLTSQFLLATQQCFGGRDPDAFALCIGFFARILGNVDDLPKEIKQSLAFTLFPIIEMSSNHFESPLFMSNKRMQLALIPFILFLINNSDSKILYNFFHTLSISFKCHFISFLRLTVKIIFDTLDVVKPTYSSPQINVNLLELTTHVLFKFLSHVKDELGVCMKEVVELIQTMLNEYQPTDNYKYFYMMCKDLFDTYPMERTYINFVIRLLTFRQVTARSLATALIIRAFVSDYDRYKQINVSSLSFMDTYATLVLESKIDKIPLYKSFVMIIKDQCPDKEVLRKKVEDRMESAMSIAEIVEKQKGSKQALSERSKQIMKLADDNMEFPNMRLKWLSELVRVNLDGGDKISAFVAQLHCCALIASIVEHRSKVAKEELNKGKKTNERMPKPPGFHLSTTQPIRTANNVYDYGRSRTYQEFFFIPSVQVETKVRVDAANADAEILLSDFTEALLLDHIKAAIFLCEEAQLYYTLRALSSMALRVLYQTREYGPSKDICEKLSNYLSSINTGNTVGVAVPLAFFLVERRQGGRVDQRVYCCKRTETTGFIKSLKHREGIIAPHEYCQTHELCKGDGVCVIQLEPADDKIEGDEAAHSWDKFRSVVSVTRQSQKSADDLANPIKTFYIETTEKLPFFHQGVAIKKIEIQEVRVKEIVMNTVDRAVTAIQQLINDFMPYLSMPIGTFKDSAFTLFGRDITRFKDMLYSTLQHPNCAKDCLLLMKAKFPDLLKEQVNKMSEQLFSMLKWMRRAVKELKEELKEGDELKKIQTELDDCTSLVSKFCKDFDLTMIDDNIVNEGVSDPMSAFCPYESEYE